MIVRIKTPTPYMVCKTFCDLGSARAPHAALCTALLTPDLATSASHSPWAVSIPCLRYLVLRPMSHWLVPLWSSARSSGFSYYPGSEHCPCSLTLCPLQPGSTPLCLVYYYVLFNLLFSQLPCFFTVRTLFTVVLLKPQIVSSTW